MENQNEIDKENLIAVIRNTPEQLITGLGLSKGIKLDKKFGSIVLSGMGGSALVGELLQIYLNENFSPSHPGLTQIGEQKFLGSEFRVKIYVNRSYSLPPESYEPGCLNIISSYSGNTEETISCFEEALKNNLDCLGIASGGKVMEICQEKNVPFIAMPKPDLSFQPRFATGYSFAALISLIANNSSIELDTKTFEETAEKLKSEMENSEKIGRELAEKIQGKTPVIYAPIKYRALAMIWKIMFNENSKTPAFWNYFPELSHNEMVGFTKPQGKFFFIMLRDKNDHPNNLKRFEITVDLFKEYGFESTIIDMPEENPLYRIFATLAIGSFASYYLALNYGVDPTPVEMVEKLKKMLVS